MYTYKYTPGVAKPLIELEFISVDTFYQMPDAPRGNKDENKFFVKVDH